jgi:hypothetical protein
MDESENFNRLNVSLGGRLRGSFGTSCQRAKLCDQFSAVSGSTWLKQIEIKSSSFHLPRDTVDGIPISVAVRPKSEAGPFECCLEVFGAIDGKHGGFDTVVLP